jgi:hypothetical protein
MKLTKETLKRIIKEELGRVMMEIEGECPPEHKQAAMAWANKKLQEVQTSQLKDDFREASLAEGDCVEEDGIWMVNFSLNYKVAGMTRTIDLTWRSNGDHEAQEGEGTMMSANIGEDSEAWISYATECLNYVS